MNEKKISIIMPVYNVEKYLVEAIESVLSQTYTNWELLMMDDCSTDMSYTIMEEYAKKDTRIHIIKAEKNSGVIVTRNHLITQANGEYIAFLDSDDYWAPEKLAHQYMMMEKNKAVLSCTAYTRVDEHGKSLNVVQVKDNIFYQDLLKKNYLGCSTVMLNVSIIGKKYFTQIRKNEDYLLWLQIIKETKIIYGLTENLAYYRVLKGSRSSNRIDAAKVRWYIYRKYEKLSFIAASYYFICYVFGVIKKNKGLIV